MIENIRICLLGFGEHFEDIRFGKQKKLLMLALALRVVIYFRIGGRDWNK